MISIKKNYGRSLYIEGVRLELNNISRGVDIKLDFVDMAKIINYWFTKFPDLKQEVEKKPKFKKIYPGVTGF